MNKPKQPAPEGWILHRIKWDYLVTLTHAPAAGKWKNPSERRTLIRWANWTRAVCKKLHIHANSFLWIRRQEIGKGGRDHFHALVNFNEARLVNKTTGHFLKGVWEQLGYGIAHCRPCDTTGANAYITKIQNQYEMNRFGSERYRAVEISRSTKKSLRRSLKGVAAHTGY